MLLLQRVLHMQLLILAGQSPSSDILSGELCQHSCCTSSASSCTCCGLPSPPGAAARTCPGGGRSALSWRGRAPLPGSRGLPGSPPPAAASPGWRSGPRRAPRGRTWLSPSHPAWPPRSWCRHSRPGWDGWLRVRLAAPLSPSRLIETIA